MILTILDGPAQGLSARAMPGQTVIVGRDATADLAVIDPLMSRHHFQIFDSAGEWQIRDLESFNGTKINDRPVTRCRLGDGDIVVAGVTRFRIDMCGKNDPRPHRTE